MTLKCLNSRRFIFLRHRLRHERSWQRSSSVRARGGRRGASHAHHFAEARSRPRVAFMCLFHHPRERPRQVHLRREAAPRLRQHEHIQIPGHWGVRACEREDVGHSGVLLDACDARRDVEGHVAQAHCCTRAMVRYRVAHHRVGPCLYVGVLAHLGTVVEEERGLPRLACVRSSFLEPAYLPRRDVLASSLTAVS